MTYVEFFDKTALENICTCLTDIPERVVFLGDNSKLMKRHIEYYKRIFTDRGHDVDFKYKTVSKSNLDNAIEILTEIVDTYSDCYFDITGGDEILSLALGVVYERNKDKNIQIHKFNVRNNMLYDCDKDGKTIYKQTPTLSVEENIRIYGGDIVYGNISEEKTYIWDITPDFINDVNLIWEVCRGNARLWNTQIGVFEAAESVGHISEDGLTTTANIPCVDAYLSRHKASFKIIKGIVNYLCKHKLITFFEYDETTLTITYKNSQVKKCLIKAGQALEMKVYLTAKSLVDSEGALIYDDVINGVVIDWDGEIHNNKEDGYDTKNEIDILMMHDIIPVFISCKNGVVTAEELYKLNTVAERFGGQYAKKVLVATSAALTGEAGKYLKQRADDMNIKLIKDIQGSDDAELERQLRNLWCV